MVAIAWWRRKQQKQLYKKKKMNVHKQIFFVIKTHNYVLNQITYDLY